MNILVSGAGINGLMTAFHLTQAGENVTVCDAGPIPNKANASYGVHRLIHPWQQKGLDSGLASVSKSLKVWNEIVEVLSCKGFENTGVLVANAIDNHIDHISLDPRHSKQVVPGSQNFPYRRLFPDYGVLMASEIQHALIQWLRANNTHFLPHSPLLDVDPDQAMATLAGHSQCVFDRIVIATGPGLNAFAKIFNIRCVRTWRCYVIYAPEKALLQPRTAWADLGGKDLWGMPPIRGFPAKFGCGGLTHLSTQPKLSNNLVRKTMSDAYCKIDSAYNFLRAGRVASNLWTEIISNNRAQRRGRCIVLSSDNGVGFKFAPIAGIEACLLTLAA